MAKNFLQSPKNQIALIFAIGLLVRVLFYLFGAHVYYGSNNFIVGRDTPGWTVSIMNLIEHGTYTVDFSTPKGYFFRPPGYAFFIGFFYLISGKNIELAYKLIPWAQILMDAVSICLIYKIVMHTLGRQRTATWAALLYTFYPFAIVWTPVAYAETSSIFFMLLGVYFMVRGDKKWNYFWSGIFIGCAVLIRLQVILFFPVICVVYLFYHRKKLLASAQYFLTFLLAFCLMYGSWPLRNYINHDRLLFSQDLGAVDCWDVDYLGFMDYIFAVKVDHEPQYSQIMNGETVTFPAASYVVPGDSAKLAYVTKLCHTCGLGFSVFMKNEGVRSHDLPRDSSCSAEIAQIFTELTENQKQHNALHMYLWVPLQNLKKALFKFSLYKPSSPTVALLSSTLFIYRTLMIFMGLLGIILYIWNIRSMPFIFSLILGYFLLWYFYNCFVYRNMEIRYLLQGDLLMLIPAGYVVDLLVTRFFKRAKTTP